MVAMVSDLQNMHYYLSPPQRKNFVFYREKIRVFKT